MITLTPGVPIKLLLEMFNEGIPDVGRTDIVISIMREDSPLVERVSMSEYPDVPGLYFYNWTVPLNLTTDGEVLDIIYEKVVSGTPNTYVLLTTESGLIHVTLNIYLNEYRQIVNADYDDHNRLLFVYLTDGSKLKYSYDTQGRPKKVELIL